MAGMPKGRRRSAEPSVQAADPLDRVIVLLHYLERTTTLLVDQVAHGDHAFDEAEIASLHAAWHTAHEEMEALLEHLPHEEAVES